MDSSMLSNPFLRGMKSLFLSIGTVQRVTLLATLTWCFVYPTQSTTGQEVRYRLGKQVIAFESAFESGCQDTTRRKKAVVSLQSAVQSFFQLDLLAAEKQIDAAHVSILSDELGLAANSVISLRLSPNKRWLDSAQSQIEWSLKQAYESKIETKLPLRMLTKYQLQKAPPAKPSVEREETVDVLPWLTQHADALDGDFLVLTTLLVGERNLRLPWQMVSFSNHRDERLAMATDRLKALPKSVNPSLSQSIKLNLGVLRDLSRDRILETDYPADTMLQRSEHWLDQAEKNEQSIDISQTGQYWLDYSRIGRSGVARIQVPYDVDPQKPYKVLIAYHGAGGSENMFFDAYGAGRIAQLAKESGYLLIAPRQPVLSGLLSFQALLDLVEKSLPIDRTQIDLIGHSMGAAQAIGQVEQCPGIARSCTILGGGRAVSKPPAWADLAVFAAAGDVDFGRRGAVAFAESAKKANAEVEQRIYENVEHLAIVQVSLTDIFDWLKKLPQMILPTQ